MMLRGRSSLIKAVLSLFMGAFLCGLIIVGFEFIFSPYRHMPRNGFVDGTRYTWGHLVKNNKYGFRERDFETVKASNTLRVMVLGDSLTWGAGLAVEERYTAIAENLLTQAFPNRKFEVLNFGISGGPTTQERDILVKLKDVVRPDLIVVGFCLNDPQQKSMNYSIEREKLSRSLIGRVVDKLSYLLLNVNLPYTAKLFNDAFYRFAMRFGWIPNWLVALGRVYEPSSRAWLEFVQALRDIKAASDEMGLPPPIFATLNQGNPFATLGPAAETYKVWIRWFRQAEKAASDVGFTAYNHELEIYERLRNQPLIINSLDGHPSASVNRIYGEKLYQVIAKELYGQERS